MLYYGDEKQSRYMAGMNQHACMLRLTADRQWMLLQSPTPSRLSDPVMASSSEASRLAAYRPDHDPVRMRLIIVSWAWV